MEFTCGFILGVLCGLLSACISVIRSKKEMEAETQLLEHEVELLKRALAESDRKLHEKTNQATKRRTMWDEPLR